jgi:poly-D-alanine transfer protein DltD
MKTPHLLPAGIALGLGAALLFGWWCYARRVEAERIHALAAPAFLERVPDRAALQREALRHDDLLPIYGSSEVLLVDPHHATVLFRDYPTGFTVFPVGGRGCCSLLHLQKLASAGRMLRGKKVVVSFTAETFFLDPTVGPERYAGNFSPVHAGELAFSLDLSYEVKQHIARRMLHYPETLEQDPLLRFAVEKLADRRLAGPSGGGPVPAAFAAGHPYESRATGGGPGLVRAAGTGGEGLSAAERQQPVRLRGCQLDGRAGASHGRPPPHLER